nr:YaiO family outer membrane beta-barrel protein [Variovorax boronicumulans]
MKRLWPARGLAWAAALVCMLGGSAQAQTAGPLTGEPSAPAPAPMPVPGSTPTRMTWDLQTTHSNLTARLPDGETVNLRGAITLRSGDVLNLELLRERKFGETGGVAAGSYTLQLSDRWYAVQSLAFGEGGENWAIFRSDTQISRKWLSQGQLVTSAAVYGAALHRNRSEGGMRLAVAWYLPAPVVLEGGVVLNVSQPRNRFSHMPFASMTVGREGAAYFSLRVASGTEAYQSIGARSELVDFHSTSVMATGRVWLGQHWGLSAQAERYSNPSYKRHTLGLGVFLTF